MRSSRPNKCNWNRYQYLQYLGHIISTKPYVQLERFLVVVPFNLLESHQYAIKGITGGAGESVLLLHLLLVKHK